ncbi:hypothetical protein QWI82_02025, partial [Acinetobacter baumannii]
FATVPFFFILSLRQVGHLIARVICISLFYQNPIGFFFSILFETLPNFKVVYHEIIKNIEFSLLKHKYWGLC